MRHILLVVLIFALLAPAAASAAPPVSGTIALENDPAYDGYALLTMTWTRHVDFPALSFTCYQDGKPRYFVAREPVEGDGTATLDIGLPVGDYYWTSDNTITCIANLSSYDVRWKPFVSVRSITLLDSVTFDISGDRH